MQRDHPFNQGSMNSFRKILPEAVARRCSVKKVLIEISQNSQRNTCAGVSFLIKLQASACNFIKKETLAQGFSCEFCEISKNIFFTEHVWATASKQTDDCFKFSNRIQHQIAKLFLKYNYINERKQLEAKRNTHANHLKALKNGFLENFGNSSEEI